MKKQLVEEMRNKAIAITVRLENEVFHGSFSSSTLECIERIIGEELTTTAQIVREEIIKEITHKWNKGELKLDGTTQGAVNCIEHFREYLTELNNEQI